MSSWRMAFRYGEGGRSYWFECMHRGIAAAGHYSDDGEGFPDCSHMSKDEFEEAWSRFGHGSVSGQIALRHLRFDVSPGDTIFAREGDRIVGCGRVFSGYEYDDRVLSGTGCGWSHFVKVDWDPDFLPVIIQLRAPRVWLLRLNATDLRQIAEAPLVPPQRKLMWTKR